MQNVFKNQFVLQCVKSQKLTRLTNLFMLLPRIVIVITDQKKEKNMKKNICLLFALCTIIPISISADFWKTTESDLVEAQEDIDAAYKEKKASNKASTKKDQTKLDAKKTKKHEKDKATKKAKNVREEAQNKKDNAYRKHQNRRNKDMEREQSRYANDQF